MAPPREEWYTLDTGLRYHALAWGNVGSDHVVVLLHGFLNLAWGWEDTAAALPPRYRVVAPDLRGHGDSDRVGAGGYYHFLDYLADVASLVDQLAPQNTGDDADSGRRVSLVGHSMGGSVAAYFAGAYPQRVHRLAMLEGTGPPDDPTDIPERVPEWISGWRSVQRKGRATRSYPHLAEAAAQLRRHDDRLGEEQALRLAEHGTVRGEDGRLRFKHDPLHLTRGPLPFRREVALSFYRRVRCPVLLVEAAESWLRHAPDEASLRHGAFADARHHLLPEAGHMMQRHQPAALAALLAEFLGVTAALLPLLLACAQDANTRDFDALLDAVAQRYVYLDRQRTHLDLIRQRLRPRAAAARTRAELIAVLEQTLEPLADGHATLNTNTPASTRLIPSGLDLWAEWREGRAVVTQVRAGWPAAQAGVLPGDVVRAVNGVALETALAARAPCCTEAAAPVVRQWTLLALLAGRHDTPRRLDLGSRELLLGDPDQVPAAPLVTQQRLAGGIGVIGLHHVGDRASVAAFDTALAALRDSAGLILDLRDTAAGGDTAVAEPILGRLIRRRQPYQRIVPRAGAPWLRTVAPRGPWRYEGPLVVLVGRWTGSMGEGMAIGLDGMKRATVIGSRMAGLQGAVYTYTLPCSGIRYNLPGDRLTHLDGTPREAFVPPVLIEDSAGRDAALERARAHLAAGGGRP